LLLPPDVTDLTKIKDDPSTVVAALFAHRNIIFGARVFHPGCSMADICSPLVKMAVTDSETDGVQPQAMASLRGLSLWVKQSFERYNALKEERDDTISKQNSVSTSNNDSFVSQTLIDFYENNNTDALEAVRAIATGVPRPGHSVVGQGTYRDGEEAWKALATEFVELGLSEESRLYQQHGGRLVTIEHLAEQNPKYMRSAGGAMARFFFL
jgi:hypothetical protein